MLPLEGAGGVIIDVAGIIAGLAAMIAAFASIISARRSGKTVKQTNGPLTLIHSEVRGIGHQIGELRDDLHQLADRHDKDVRELRNNIQSK